MGVGGADRIMAAELRGAGQDGPSGAKSGAVDNYKDKFTTKKWCHLGFF